MCFRAFRWEPRARSDGGSQVTDQQVDLLAKKIERTVVEEDKIGQLTFPCQRQLLGQSLAGEFRRYSALFKPPYLLGAVCCDADRKIKPILQVFLEKQWHLHNPWRTWLREFLPPQNVETRMQKLFQPSERAGVAEHVSGYDVAADIAFFRNCGRPKLAPDCGHHFRLSQ